MTEYRTSWQDTQSILTTLWIRPIHTADLFEIRYFVIFRVEDITGHFPVCML